MAFWNRKKDIKYKPTGKIGWFNMNGKNILYGSPGFNYSVIVEALYTVGERTKVKILEVDIHKNCNRTKADCLIDYGRGEWVVTNQFQWETMEQYNLRINNPITYTAPEPLNNDNIDYTPRVGNPFVHNFVENNE